MKSLLAGLKIALQGHNVSIAYLSWEGIESRACGEKIFNTEKLKSITKFDRCNEELEERFWRVFESFSELEKQQYLKFVWGRTRLPIDISKLQY